MTKLSDVRFDHDRDHGGSWFHWRGTIYLKVRRFGTRAYQRALRRAQLEHTAPPADASPEDKAAYEEKLGAALIPAIAEHILVDWWGLDQEAEPIEAPEESFSTVAVVDDYELESAFFDGKHWRRADKAGLVQEMEPYSVSRAMEILSDPRCADLLDAVRTAAQILDVRRLREDVAALGKRKSTPAGSSSTATAKAK